MTKQKVSVSTLPGKTSEPFGVLYQNRSSEADTKTLVESTSTKEKWKDVEKEQSSRKNKA